MGYLLCSRIDHTHPCANNHCLLSRSLQPPHTPRSASCSQPNTQTLRNPPNRKCRDTGQRGRTDPSAGVLAVLWAAGCEWSREDIHLSHGDGGRAAQQGRGHAGRPQVRGFRVGVGQAVRLHTPTRGQGGLEVVNETPVFAPACLGPSRFPEPLDLCPQRDSGTGRSALSHGLLSSVGCRL